MVDVYNIWFNMAVLRRRDIVKLLVQASLTSMKPGIEKDVLELHLKHFNTESTHLKGEDAKSEETLKKILGEVVSKHPTETDKFLQETIFTDENEMKSFIEIAGGSFKLKVNEDIRKFDILVSLACPLCRLFGALGLRSKLVFEDTVVEEYQTHMRTCTSIDRSSRVAPDKALFTQELIYPGRVKEEIIVLNVGPGSTEALILALVLEYILNFGILVGGRKSTGLGYLTVDEKESVVYVNDFTSVEDSRELVELLAKHDLSERYRKSLREYISYLRGESK